MEREMGTDIHQCRIKAENIYKKFNRSNISKILLKICDTVRYMLGRTSRGELHKTEFWALQGISLTVRAGECVGIIGPNGAGKSTLLKIIGREQKPDKGMIKTNGRILDIGHTDIGLQPLLSGRENIYISGMQSGLNAQGIEKLIQDVIDFSGLCEAIDRPVKTYSDGMHTRLKFALAAHLPHDILIIDEILAVGDIAFQVRCLEQINKLKAAGSSVILVSHSDLNIRYVADHCLLLFDGKEVASGDPAAVYQKYYSEIGLDQNKIGLYSPHRYYQKAGAPIVRIENVTHASNADDEYFSSISFDVGIEITEKLEEVHFSIELLSSDNKPIFSLDSIILGQCYDLAEGSHRLRVNLNQLALWGNQYHVKFEICKKDFVFASEHATIVVKSANQMRDFRKRNLCPQASFGLLPIRLHGIDSEHQ